MRYGILGSTQVHTDDGNLLPLGGARLRALVAALALHPGRVVSPRALIDEVWDGEPPADATGALQALVGRLRRVVGHATVVSADGGYRLCAEPDHVDLHRFERLADEGERALADADPAKAAALLDDALALWRGPALADLPGRTATAARCDTRHLAARRGRLAADVALGNAAAALPALAELCDAHPLDEPLQALRLRALRDAGRPAEALAAYAGLAGTLADRLGTDPGPELRALHAELLAGPQGPAGPGPAATPARPRADHAAPPADGDAPRAGGPAPAPAAAAAPAPAAPPRGNLRARLTSFVGREDDLALIREDLGRHRLVTLLGPGGAGKTRLSQEAAEAAAMAGERWPDGVWFAELAPVDDPETVPEAVLTALGARETVVRGTTAEGLRAATDATALDPLGRLAEHCARRRMLLVLDNCEHVVDAAALLAETLLAHCPGVAVLATSREPLAVPGELVRPVEPLPDPVALRLLADRGAAARPGFRVEDDPAACAEICRRLDGLPLAIELAAARLRLLTPRGLADRLDDRFRLLTSGSRTVLPRQQTLRAVVDWSWDLLDEPERAVLRRLSVFSGGCDLALAEEVCADGTAVDARDVPVLLGSLVDKSLVVAAPAADGHMRYRLLETVGEYAGERLDEAGERAAVERLHLVAFRELARTADPLLRGPEQRDWLERLELEHDNLRSALRRALAARDEQEALCLVLSLGWFWQLRDHRADARHWAEAAAALGPDPFAEPVTPAPPLHGTCTEVPPPLPPDLLEEARRGVRLIAISNVDANMREIGDPEMQRLLRGIVTAYGDGQPQNCRVPGMMWYYAILMTGAADDMYTVLDDAVERCRRLGYRWELANMLQLRAKVLNDSPDRTGQAIADADEGLELFRGLGDSWGVAEALAGRGETLEKHGRFAAAADDYREAVDRVLELGSAGQVPMLRARLATVLAEDGALGPAQAEEIYREALADAQRISPDVAAFVQVQLGCLLGRNGRPAEAREIFEALAEDFGERAIVVFEALMDGLLAWLDTLQGRPGDALPRLRSALGKSDDPLSRLIAPQLAPAQLLNAGHAYAVLGGEADALRAARLFGASAALRPAVFHVMSMEREILEAGAEAARAVVGAEAYERAYAEGAGLSLVEAAALV
ncbi:AfsR/SARP family transcriptional regulator [Streptomyces griseocarneus]|uniref:AfsR/SARP family transcriptional regulator n=1 Tax=Streptomyces griseocarneus TaxID=51201 RepID=UPI001CCC30E2|nr:BTAD domain-containing putative transcriptional regulator [Streptomyces griseocarneus]MBZ6472116.1 winged helix-turn-helix domain-containing protein [Streptomyces griseocarneus]